MVRFAYDKHAQLGAWERQPWWRSTAVLRAMSQIDFAILLLTLVTIPVQAAVRWRDSPLASMPILHRGMIVSLWLAALAGGIVPLLWVSIIQRVMTFTADDQTIDGQILGASLIPQIGRETCRERRGTFDVISVVGGCLKKK